LEQATVDPLRARRWLKTAIGIAYVLLVWWHYGMAAGQYRAVFLSLIGEAWLSPILALFVFQILKSLGLGEWVLLRIPRLTPTAFQLYGRDRTRGFSLGNVLKYVCAMGFMTGWSLLWAYVPIGRAQQAGSILEDLRTAGTLVAIFLLYDLLALEFLFDFQESSSFNFHLNTGNGYVSLLVSMALLPALALFPVFLGVSSIGSLLVLAFLGVRYVAMPCLNDPANSERLLKWVSSG
jgi:hypothetical protein